MDLFSHSDKTEWLLLSWAFKHPYLYTAIKILPQALVVLLITAVGKLVWRTKTR